MNTSLWINTCLLLCAASLVTSSRRQRIQDSSSSSSEEDVGQSYQASRHARRNVTLSEIMNSKVSHEAEALSGEELVAYVNRHQNLWRARLNPKFSSYDENIKWKLMGVNNVHNSIEAKKTLGKSRFLDIELPKNFDSRTNWPNCESLKAIRDQSSCGSCWAFGAVEAMSDRICIASGGKIQVSLSADDLLSCCGIRCGFGCNGGDPLAAWKFWVRDGIVTGSNFTANQGCRPYPFPPCEHHSNKTHYQPCKHELFPTPKCEQKCQASYNQKTYKQDKFFGKSAYSVEDDVQSIQNELFTNGPLEVAFEVYEDFLNYDGGIYYHQGGKLGGGHAVKLVGWGEENSIPYWIVANSWNTDWGEDGFFRILRGKDECGIESGVVGGLPDISRYYADAEFVDGSDGEMVERHSNHQHRRHAYD